MKISPLQFITHDHPELSAADQVEKALQAGLKWVQLRLKNADEFIWEKEAVESMEHCEKYGGTLIINDNVEVAQRVMAHGVHLGKSDMNAEEARSILGNDYIIGRTCNTPEDISECNALPVNYIGLGPYSTTTTKNNLSQLLGVEGLQIAVQSNLPVIGIGGITLNDLGQLKQVSSLHGIAFSGLLLQSEDWTKTVAALKQHWDA